MIVLDTHAWLWWVQGAGSELPAGARRFIDCSPAVGVASVSCLEVAWLAKKGRIALPVPIEEFFAAALEGSGVELIALTPSIAARSAALPDIHRDPIDRVIIASAIDRDAELITRDGMISQYPGVRVRWD
ncbi:MAG TPA: type II toxin-antitoxin system VapC family toxin [Polyangiaceae bacterium]|nr:type II toxin-antitoxin system VapC family toxin [Polyangiaceae bacterium]